MKQRASYHDFLTAATTFDSGNGSGTSCAAGMSTPWQAKLQVLHSCDQSHLHCSTACTCLLLALVNLRYFKLAHERLTTLPHGAHQRNDRCSSTLQVKGQSIPQKPLSSYPKHQGTAHTPNPQHLSTNSPRNGGLKDGEKSTKKIECSLVDFVTLSMKQGLGDLCLSRCCITGH